MSRTTTTESDDEMVSKEQTDSSSFDEGNSKGVGGGIVLKKGPWTSQEDAILIDYVKKHGEGNWNAVQKHSGLYRCGKSCRLRWANHLRPNLKKGAFTADEERLIIELHAKMGNKWARMASHLPGRTDNEIKNYWNTRIKRRQRAGLPLYPPDVSFQTQNQSQQNQNIGEVVSGDSRHHDLLQGNNCFIPDVVFDNLKANPGVLSYSPPLPNVSVNNMLSPSIGSSQSFGFMPSIMQCGKRLRESDTLVPGYAGGFANRVTTFDPFQNASFEKVQQACDLEAPYDPDPQIKNAVTSSAVLAGSHALPNGFFSASKSPMGILKQELPSLQYPDSDLSSWGACPTPTPSLDAVDAYIQPQSLETVQLQSECFSPQNSGLLEAFLYEAKILGSSKNRSSESGSNFLVPTPTEVADSSQLNLCQEEWNCDPISPLGHSAASIFSECTPPISSSSFDESPPSKILAGCEIKVEPFDCVSTLDGGKFSQSDPSRPDLLLGADFFGRNSDYSKDLAAFIGEDLFSDCKPIAAGTSSSSQGCRSFDASTDHGFCL